MIRHYPETGAVAQYSTVQYVNGPIFSCHRWVCLTLDGGNDGLSAGLQRCSVQAEGKVEGSFFFSVVLAPTEPTDERAKFQGSLSLSLLHS